MPNPTQLLLTQRQVWEAPPMFSALYVLVVSAVRRLRGQPTVRFEDHPDDEDYPVSGF